MRILLIPFAIIYNLVTWLRNRLYDSGLKPVATFDVPVINVGNITVGGTGKTPMAEYLIRLLTPGHGVATLSRGYGRKTRGFKIAGPADNAATIGDEPYQFYKKYGERITVTVGEDRAFAIPNILQEKTETEVIILDDAFQHRSVKPSLNILLSDYNRPFYHDFLLPAGRLRESARGASRADIVVITKCPPGISEDAMMEIEKSVRKYVEKPLFFSALSYGSPMPFGAINKSLSGKIILVTGIANARPLKNYLRSNYKIEEHFEFADHHDYTQSDLEQLLKRVIADPAITIITTEKDRVKLEAEAFKSITSKLPLFSLPIEVNFLKSGRDFDEIVLNHVRDGGSK